MLLGSYIHTIDGKGRVFVPAKYREMLAGELIIVKGLDKNLVLYNEEQWKRFEEKIDSLEEIEVLPVKRYIYSSVVTTELDSQGRIVIPENLREYVGIEKEVEFVGLGTNVEIWKPAEFDAENGKQDPEKMKSLLRSKK